MRFLSIFIPLALGASMFALCTGLAFSQVLEAEYKLLADLKETNQAYADMSHGGNPAPAPPNNGICINGLHPLVFMGQSASTPPIRGLNIDDFEVTVEFKVDAIDLFGGPVIMGGGGWLGVYVFSNRQIAIRFGGSAIEVSNAAISIGTWHSSTIKYEAGVCELWLDGNLVLATYVGALLNPLGNLRFQTDYFGTLSNLDGCIRELAIYNDTTIVSSPPVGTSYCPQQPVNPNDPVVTISGSVNAGFGSGLHLEMGGGPAGELGYFLVGNGAEVNPTIMLGNSVLCLKLGGGFEIGRYNVAGTHFNSLGQFDAAGVFQSLSGNSTVGSGFDVPVSVPMTGMPTTSAGMTWHFQGWYRDSAAGVGLSNASDGLSVSL